MPPAAPAWLGGVMPDGAWNVLLNIIASAITGLAVWATQRTVWRRRLRRQRRFFGLRAGEDCLMVVNRHSSSPNARSVHRTDVAAMLLLAGRLEICGARPQVVFHDEPSKRHREQTEFCIGGPDSNARTAAHLRWSLAGVKAGRRHADDPEGLAISVGDVTYRREADLVVYAVLAKIPRRAGRPVFLVCGQTAIANQGAVGYLVERYRELVRAHGAEGRFCLVLRVVEPAVYGPSRVELVRDATHDAFADAGHRESG